MTELSVVLISKNQEWNIARLIESVLRETNRFTTNEFILVDSASTDQTTKIAAQYPITVLKLSPKQRLTAAAGRYVGYKQTTGDLVLFLDGDMELCPGWLGQALCVLDSQSNVAVVCGQVMDRPINSAGMVENGCDYFKEQAPAIDVSHSGGAAMYRRSVLEKVGTFNPYLYSDEEPELCLRIRLAGYRIVRLLCPNVFHYTAPAETLATFLAKRRGNLWHGYGQNIRYLFGESSFWPYLQERGWAIAPAIFFFLAILTLVLSIFSGQWKWLGLLGGILIVLLIALAVWKRSIKRAILILLRRIFILDGTIRGLLLKPYDPSGYPGKYEVIQ